ncbi:TIM barrel protein [Candidatus Woesearchaeota archaeon]|nr:TIM barrel protein [Candidatus Woesearchaeota archaeon]
MKNLFFGTAGIPLSTKLPNTLNGIKRVKELNLNAMELEFVRSVNISEKSAPDVEKEAKLNNIILTCHAPYYINLNSLEKAKLIASRHRIIESARIAYLCGAYSIAFHAGFYQGMNKEYAYNNIKENIKLILKELRDKGINITIRPELTGKPTQFGDLNEIVKLSSELENVLPCIDFAHFHARTNKKNSYQEFSNLLSHIEEILGRTALKNMHIHVAGINYSIKGELNHLNLKESDMKYTELVKAFKDFSIKGVVISESPNIESDALLLKGIYLK